jgi:hypothetical protein
MRTMEELLRAWSDAEASGDLDALDRLLDTEFRGDGPAGQVLDRDGWLDRFRRRDLVVAASELTVAGLLTGAGTAVAVGTLVQIATHRGRDASGSFPWALVAVRRDGGWQVANVQLGPDSARWPMSGAAYNGSLEAMSTKTSSGPDIAAGPLVVSDANPRYFAIGDGAGRRTVYLTGSHIWNNFHDGLGPGSDCAEAPERNDFGAYLAFLRDHGHNFIRLWRWEQFKSQAANGAFHLCMSPQPWLRTGPGTAKDGGLKFDLSRHDEAYFTRLRDRVVRAGEAGIYVDVMLFDGWGLHLGMRPDNIEGHPFHAASNVNGIGIASMIDYQVLPLDPRIREIQEAYIKRVVDTVEDLPNVLYEVANEASGKAADRVEFPDGSSLEGPIGDTTEWQYWVIELVKRYERERDYMRHPIGMTMLYPVPDQSRVNDVLLNSPADWISPGFDDQIFPHGRWYTDPPSSDGSKVLITDTDHYAPGSGDALWAWKSFVRGQHPILMDFGIIDVANPLDPSTGVPPTEAFEPGRLAMGDTRRYAERMDLAATEPRGDLASTTFALANPGREYLVLQPEGSAFTVTPDPGTYRVEWFAVDARETAADDDVTVERVGPVEFRAPFPGPAVLYLRRG